jgi:hypothetical protein
MKIGNHPVNPIFFRPEGFCNFVANKYTDEKKKKAHEGRDVFHGNGMVELWTE